MFDVDFLTKLSIYIMFYIIEKLNISEIKTGNTYSVQQNKAPDWDFSIRHSSQLSGLP